MYDNIYSTGFSIFELEHELETGTETGEVAAGVVVVVIVVVVLVFARASDCQCEIARLVGRGI